MISVLTAWFAKRALGAWLVEHWRLIATGLLALAVISGALWLVHYGRVIERGAEDAASLSNLRDRSAIDNEIQLDDDLALCLRLGGGAECHGLSNGR